MPSIRKAVSKKKRRYQKDGYDLDLSYITTQIIAMGFPSSGSEGVYRNPMKEVVRFLEDKHKNHYRVYNLCSERSYDISKFNNAVESFPFDDHNAPPFELISQFCDNVEKFLKEDDKNTVVIHCKAGKGRTGLMICCYLLHSREWTSAIESMAFYAAMRTYNQKGVTIPSQIRYVHYYGSSLDEGYRPKTLILKKIVLKPSPKDTNASDLKVGVYIGPSRTSVFSHKGGQILSNEDGNYICFTECFESNSVPIAGDCLLKFDYKGDKFITFAVNTSYIENGFLSLTKLEIDKAHKDKNCKVFPKDFRAELIFENYDQDSVSKGNSRLSVIEIEEKGQKTVASEKNSKKSTLIMEKYQSLKNL